MTKLVILAGAIGWLASGDWLIGACLLVLRLVRIVLQPDEGTPVIALASRMQWRVDCLGLFYRRDRTSLDATIHSDYRTMVMIGLGVLLATIAGLYVGRRLVGLAGPATGLRPAYALTFKTLLSAYVLGTIFVGAIQTAAWDYPGLAQAILALAYLRLGLLYLVLRRLVVSNQWHYLADYSWSRSSWHHRLLRRLPRAAHHGGLGVPRILRSPQRTALDHHYEPRGDAAILGVAWIGVRVEYRRRFAIDDKFINNRSARIDLLKASISDWAGKAPRDDGGHRSFRRPDVDHLLPALAISRVPRCCRTNGQLMTETLQYPEPRLFFPDKPDIKSDSEMVRKAQASGWLARIS
jgi:hypothetical protein